MLGTAPITKFCFGFDKVDEESLLVSSPGDMGTRSDQLVPWAEGIGRDYVNFCTPESMINKNSEYPGNYNEMLFKKEQNGKRIQPSYVVVFKENGTIKNIEMAKNAASSFNPKLPIIVVDKEKCAESEKNKIENMLSEYEKTQDIELAKKINQKVKNNTIGNSCFNLDKETREKVKTIIEESDISKEDSVITESEYKECYENVNIQDKQKAFSKITQIYRALQEIRDKGDKDNSGENNPR